MATKTKGSGFTEHDAARLTDASKSDVEQAWHDARDDAQRAGELPERMCNKSRERLRSVGINVPKAAIRARGGHVEIIDDALARLVAMDPRRAEEVRRALESVVGVTSVSIQPER